MASLRGDFPRDKTEHPRVCELSFLEQGPISRSN